MRLRLQTGYDIVADLPHGFNLVAGNLILSFHYDWPRPVWFNRDWAVDESGYVQGMAVKRSKPKRWLLRGIEWPIKLRMKWL